MSVIAPSQEAYLEQFRIILSIFLNEAMLYVLIEVILMNTIHFKII